jgi:predicted nuclease with TOPRIM domain
MRQELNKVNEKLDKMEVKFTQLNETLKQINANLAAQNVKLKRLETLEATVRSLERRGIYYEKKEYDDQPTNAEIDELYSIKQSPIIASGQKKKEKRKLHDFAIFADTVFD